jgi:ribosomal protein L29
MKASELHQLSVDDLKAKLVELREERFRLRFRSATESILIRWSRITTRWSPFLRSSLWSSLVFGLWSLDGSPS